VDAGEEGLAVAVLGCATTMVDKRTTSTESMDLFMSKIIVAAVNHSR
jgi:hypothetical protein